MLELTWEPAPDPKSFAWVRAQVHPDVHTIVKTVAHTYGYTIPLAYCLVLNYLLWKRQPVEFVIELLRASGQTEAADLLEQQERTENDN